LFKRFVVEPKTSFRTVAVVIKRDSPNLAADSQRCADTSERANHHGSLAAIKQERDEYERVLESDVGAYFGNADRDS
jgi:hypothetical protein